MSKYETILIFEATLSDTDRTREIERVEEMLKSHGATDIFLEDWGKREILYGIHKRPSGHYVCFNYDCDDAKLQAELTAHLRIVESVTKFQTHKLSDRTRKFKGRTPRPAEDTAAA